MLLVDVASASSEVGAVSSRLAKISRIATLLGAAASSGDADQVAVVVSWLSGELPQRQIDVGLGGAAHLAATRRRADAHRRTRRCCVHRDRRCRGHAVAEAPGRACRPLFSAATAAEQTFLRRLLQGELRQGALAGVMADAVAAMLGGDLPAVVTAALTGGGDALGEFTVKVGRPVGPMLAQTATGVADALEPLGGTAVFEAKLDGARLQIHRDGADVSLYTRSLDDVSSLGVWVSDGSRWIAVSALSNYPAAFFGSRQVLHIRRMSAYDNAAPPATDRRPPSSRPL